MSFEKSKWQKELEIFTSIKSTFLLEGNIYDTYPHAGPDGQVDSFLRLDRYLYQLLREEMGYDAVVYYDPVNGFYNNFERDPARQVTRLVPELMERESRRRRPAPGGQNQDPAAPEYSIYGDEEGAAQNESILPEDNTAAAQVANKLLTGRGRTTAVVMNFSSRYAARPDDLDAGEREMFLNLYHGSLQAAQQMVNGRPVRSLLFIICDKTNDIPAWFYLSNPMAKTITIPAPDKNVRALAAGRMAPRFAGYNGAAPEQQERFKAEFTSRTDGFKLLEIMGLRDLAARQELGIDQLNELLSLYRYGIKENPWQKVDRQRLERAEEQITKRVKGQELAVRRAVDVIKRAATGMSGLQHSSSSAKPRGILFLAGPTGTGKTELAKSIAELLFDDESACIRFDMSEYGEPQSDQKLLGAPPGYVGYEAGGQLTNAVRERPFSILLFDEIEKAHTSIFDKFLQILDDGRMTDGRGETVYFNECIIIFTSNLGITVPDPTSPTGRREAVRYEDHLPYEELSRRINEGVKDHFVKTMGRPEIYNRLGNNILVFDYIREDVVDQILEKQLGNVAESLAKNQSLTLLVEPGARAVLREHALRNLGNGGRGVGNAVEEMFLNPLSRVIFDEEPRAGSLIHIQDIYTENGVAQFRYKIGG